MMRGHLIALRGAGLHRGLRHGDRDGEREVLVGGQLGIRRGGDAAGQCQRDSGDEVCSPDHVKSSVESRVTAADENRMKVGSFAYLRSADTLSMPALAQTSSLWPPGAPDTPMAPIVSSPMAIGNAPCAATMLLRKSAPAVGLPLTFSANLPDGMRSVRAV